MSPCVNAALTARDLLASVFSLSRSLTFYVDKVGQLWDSKNLESSILDNISL